MVNFGGGRCSWLVCGDESRTSVNKKRQARINKVVLQRCVLSYHNIIKNTNELFYELFALLVVGMIHQWIKIHAIVVPTIVVPPKVHH